MQIVWTKNIWRAYDDDDSNENKEKKLGRKNNNNNETGFFYSPQKFSLIRMLDFVFSLRFFSLSLILSLGRSVAVYTPYASTG